MEAISMQYSCILLNITISPLICVGRVRDHVSNLLYDEFTLPLPPM
jgi:hypothetical protein